MRSPGYSPFIRPTRPQHPRNGRVERHVAGQAAELRHHDGAFAFRAFARASASLGWRSSAFPLTSTDFASTSGCGFALRFAVPTDEAARHSIRRILGRPQVP
jgi:hypothetical protein